MALKTIALFAKFCALFSWVNKTTVIDRVEEHHYFVIASRMDENYRQKEIKQSSETWEKVRRRPKVSSYCDTFFIYFVILKTNLNLL